MLRKSFTHHRFLLSSTSVKFTNSTNNKSTGGGVNETAFPDDADWLGGSGHQSTITNYDSLARTSSNNSNNNNNSLASSSNKSTSSILDPGVLRQSVPMDIRHTNTEAIMNMLEKKSSLAAAKAGFEKVKKGDVSDRTQRALAAVSRRQDHFLLADLDPDLDTVMFGTSTEEFEQNVERMKVIVSTYTKWERWDKFYMYATRVIQAGCVIVGFMLWEAVCEKNLLRTAAEDYAAQHQGVVKAIADNRNQSIEYLLADMKQNPPKILPPSKQKYEEYKKLSAVDDIQRHPMDTRPEIEWEREKELLILQRAAQRDAMMNTADHEFMKRARRVILPMTDDWTTVVKEEIADYQKSKMDQLTFPRLSYD